MQISRGKIKSAQKVIIYGPEGIGKSTFASKFPNPLFIDTEGSTKHMDVARTDPKPSSWSMLLSQISYIKSNPSICGTLAIDTADWAEQLCIEDLCARHKKDGIEDFGYGKGYVYLAEEFGRLLNALSELIDIGINVVLTAHAWMRKFDQPDEMGSYDRWEMKLQKKTAPLVKEWADMVLFANYKTYVIKKDDKSEKGKAQGGKRVIYTTHHPCWDAKNRHDLKDEIAMDYKEIAHCIPYSSAVKQSELNITPPSEPPKQEQEQEISKEEQLKTEPPKEPSLDGVPKPLADLMKANDVAVFEIQKAVASKGYYPEGTPIENYDPNFIAGVLVGAWPQVFQLIQKMRENGEMIPF